MLPERRLQPSGSDPRRAASAALGERGGKGFAADLGWYLAGGAAGRLGDWFFLDSFQAADAALPASHGNGAAVPELRDDTRTGGIFSGGLADCLDVESAGNRASVFGRGILAVLSGDPTAMGGAPARRGEIPLPPVDSADGVGGWAVWILDFSDSALSEVITTGRAERRLRGGCGGFPRPRRDARWHRVRKERPSR